MTYLAPHKSNSTRNRAIGSVLIAIVLIAVAIQFLAPHFFPSVATTIARPFWRIEFSIESGSLRQPESLIAENESLRRQILENEVRLQSVHAVELENTELKGLLGRTTSTSTLEDQNGILAAVFRHPPFTAYDELIIDIGRDFKISSSSRVFAPGHIEIGRVIDVLAHTSKILLYSSPGETHNVLIGESHTPGTATGQGGGQYEAQLPRDVKIFEGDIVTAPSISGELFGVVKSINIDPALTFQSVLFAPPVNIYDLRWVMVER